MLLKKILAIKLRALGDTVLMTAPLLELRRAYPEAEIHALVHTSWAPILEKNPAINRILTFDRHSDTASRAKAVARMALRLRKEKYDCTVNFHASPSSALLSFATGAKIRANHFHGHLDKNRYSTLTIPGKGVLKPIIERDMDAVRALGIHIPAGRLPQLFLQDSEIASAKKRFQLLNLPSPILSISLGSSRPAKSWPIERFASLAVAWCQKEKGGVYAVAGPGESALVHRFMESLNDHLTASVQIQEEKGNIRGRIATEEAPPIRELAALFQQSQVFLGNDSGPKHVAVAVNTPTVTLFGPDHPFEWHPYPPDRHPFFYIDNLECRRDAEPGMPAWCGIHTCIVEEHRCMRLIGIDPVLAQCQKLVKPQGPHGT